MYRDFGVNPVNLTKPRKVLARKRPELDFRTKSYVSEQATRIAETASQRARLSASSEQLGEYLGILGRIDDAQQMAARLIPTVIDQNPCAHLRMPRDMIFHGWSMRLFQAWQHSATMSS